MKTGNSGLCRKSEIFAFAYAAVKKLMLLFYVDTIAHVKQKQANLCSKDMFSGKKNICLPLIMMN